MKKRNIILLFLGMTLVGCSNPNSKEDQKATSILGPRTVASTPLSKGEIFASSDADPKATKCTKVASTVAPDEY